MLRFSRLLPLKFLMFSPKKGISFDLRSREAYKDLEVVDSGKGIFEIMLKGKRLRTPSKKPLKSTVFFKLFKVFTGFFSVPSVHLAKEIVSELQTEKQDLDNDNPLVFLFFY